MAVRTRLHRVRIVLLGVIAGGLTALVVALATEGPGYEVRIDFADAGQLLSGDLVEVGGVPVGSIRAITLTPNGEAQLTLSLHDFAPLHEGTTASIGTVGLSGVTNRFVALVPGPAGEPPLRSGATIPELDTTPIVDIDEVLDTFTPRLRGNLSNWIQEAATVLHANVGAARQTLTYAAAGLERTSAFVGQVTEDGHALRGLISAGAATAQELTASGNRLGSVVQNTATALGAVASVQSQLSDAIARAPRTLNDASAFLTRLDPALISLEPVMRDVRPVAGPLAAVVTQLVPTAHQLLPLLPELDRVLPVLDRAFTGLPELTATATPGLRETTLALKRSRAILTGLRPYGEDILMGFLHGYGGGSSENYDANGQFSRIALGLPLDTALSADLGVTLQQAAPHFLTGQTNKCPGSAAEPAADGSNRIVADGCDPKETP